MPSTSSADHPQRAGDRPEVHPLGAELAAHRQLGLELRLLDHRLVGRRVPLVELVRDQRPAVIGGGEDRVLLAELQVFLLELLDLIAQLVPGLGDERDHLVGVLLVVLLEELLVGRHHGVDDLERLDAGLGLVADIENLRLAVGPNHAEAADDLGRRPVPESRQGDRALDDQRALDDHEVRREVIVRLDRLEGGAAAGDAHRVPPLLEEEQPGCPLVDGLDLRHVEDGHRHADQDGDREICHPRRTTSRRRYSSSADRRSLAGGVSE